jgi:hypothetical protein
VERQAGQAKDQIEYSKKDIAALEERLDQLALKCQALWELLREESDLKDDDIYKRIHEVDLRDGVADGKMTGTAQACVSCGRTIGKRYTQCLYCGDHKQNKEVFEK